MNMEHPHTSSIPTRRASDIGFFRQLTLTVVSLFVIFMAIIGIAWLVMHPHDPGFGVASLSVSKFSVSDSYIIGKYEVGLTVTNPNKKVQVILDRFNVVVLYDEAMLSVAVVQQPVLLEKMSNKSMKVDLVVRKSPDLVPENLVKDWKKGVVNFDVKMMVRVKFEAGIWPSREKILGVYCGNLDVEFYSLKDTGKLLGIRKDCHLVNVKP